MSKYVYSGIGKDWSQWGEVSPEDREAWERLAEEEIRPVKAVVCLAGSQRR